MFASLTAVGSALLSVPIQLFSYISTILLYSILYRILFTFLLFSLKVGRIHHLTLVHRVEFCVQGRRTFEVFRDLLTRFWDGYACNIQSGLQVSALTLHFSKRLLGFILIFIVVIIIVLRQPPMRIIDRLHLLHLVVERLQYFLPPLNRLHGRIEAASRSFHELYELVQRLGTRCSGVRGDNKGTMLHTYLKAVMKGTHLDMARRYSIAITHFHEMCADVKDSAHGCFPHNPTLYCNTAMLKAIESFPHALVELRNLEDLQR